MPNDSDEQTSIDAQDFETIEDLRKAKERRGQETPKSGFLPFFFEDYMDF